MKENYVNYVNYLYYFMILMPNVCKIMAAFYFLSVLILIYLNIEDHQSWNDSHEYVMTSLTFFLIHSN
jgi:hypothetical protein